MSFGLIVFLLLLGSLFFHDQHLPRWAVDRLEAVLSSETILTRLEGATVGFRQGVRFHHPRVYDLTRQEKREIPIAQADLVTVDWFRRKIEIIAAEYLRLPDSYYDPEISIVKHCRLEPELPDLPEFDVRLEHPSILGLAPDFLTVRLAVGKSRIDLRELHVAMPDRDRKLQLDGNLSLDFETQRLTGRVEGLARHAQIAPVVDVLNAPYVQPYVAAFTEVNDPIPTVFTIDCSLFSGDFDMKFDLKVPTCRYQGVPMTLADGILRVQTYNLETNRNYRFTLDLARAIDRDGRSLSGRLTVDNLAGVPRLGYTVDSTLRMEDLLAIVAVFDPETFSVLECETPPELSFKGTSGTTLEDIGANDLSGTLHLRHGSISRLKVNDFTSEFKLKRDLLSTNSRALGRNGGQLAWQDRISFEGFDMEKAKFEVKGTYKGGSVEEAATIFAVDLGERSGKVDADLELDGLLGEKLKSSLNGRGSVKIREGRLGQMKLFAGLTSQLAKRVPGVDFLVTQSDATSTFTITNGVFRSDDVYVEGGLVSIWGKGTYDISKDQLDYTVRSQLFSNESVLGRIVHSITSPLTKLLLEFKLTGSLDDPQWKYIRILDRLL